MARLRELGETIVPPGETAAIAATLPGLLPTADACLTGWGAPSQPAIGIGFTLLSWRVSC